MKYASFFLITLLVVCTSLIIVDTTPSTANMKRVIDVEEMPVEEVLLMLGDDTIQHYLYTVDPKQAAIGKELVYNGRTERDGKRTKRISPHFVCTDCHNTSREFEDLSSEAPEDRLNYAIKNNIPFLPASTFKGIYNRTSFYNKDYVKKYGDLVDAARDSLHNAIQVCAKYCSSGRYLDQWELDAIMQYFKSLEYRVKDLNLPDPVLKSIRKYGKLNVKERNELVVQIKAAYLQKYDATFMETMPRNERQYGEGGDVKNGESIFEESCMFCHENARVTYLSLGKNKLDARMFWRNRKNYRDQSLYQIVRHGTYAKPGRRQYMPLYTKEKMSDAQLNDLMAYLKQLAEK